MALRVAGRRFAVASGDVAPAPHPHADAALALALEAFGGRRVLARPRVEPVFAENLEALARRWRGWWGRPRGPFRLPRTRPGPAAPRPGDGLCALFFTAGVDSFHTLLQRLDEIDVLLFVAGFDLPLDDAPRLARVERGVREVGRALGKRVWVVRSDLRSAEPFASLDWERWHGAALAAVAWLLAPRLRRVLVSASFCRHAPEQAARPWGTHWETDPLWSGPGLRFEHVGEDSERSEKVAALAREPLARRHLSVCWQPRAGPGNCGVCEKCVRTRVLFRLAGVREELPAFAGAGDLSGAVRAIPRLPEHMRSIWGDYPLARLEPPLRDAVAGLLDRSRATRSRPA